MQDKPELTDRQRAVLAVIEQSIAARGYPPTRAEIATAMGFRSANAAQEHLQSLARKGYLTLEGSHRGIALAKSARSRNSGIAARVALQAERDDELLRLPLVGRVAAGQPILAEAHVESRFTVDPALFHPKPDYLLRVAGMSMRDAGILDGDFVAVKSAREARNGQVVVARLGDEATVKTFERDGERVRLLPANPDFTPIDVGPDDALVIEGHVVGVLRRSVQAPRPAASTRIARSARTADVDSTDPGNTASRGAIRSRPDRR